MGKVKLSDWVIGGPGTATDWSPKVEVWLGDEYVYQVHRSSKRVRFAKSVNHGVSEYGDWRTDIDLPEITLFPKLMSYLSSK